MTETETAEPEQEGKKGRKYFYSEEQRVQIFAYVQSALDIEKIRRKDWAPHLREKITVTRAITRVVQLRFQEKYNSKPPHHNNIVRIYKKMISGYGVKDRARSGRPRKHPQPEGESSQKKKKK